MVPGPRSSSTLVFTAMCFAMFCVAIEGTIVATAMPTIVAALGGLRYFAWVFGTYLLTQAVLIPIYGRLADFYGRKIMLSIGIVIFLLGSILCGFAHNMLELILFRALQGIGAAGVQPVAVTIVGDLYQGRARARAQAIMSMIWGTSAIGGPVLGAFIISRLGWPIIFWVNVPIGLVCLAVTAVAYHEAIAAVVHRIDYLGSALLAAGIGTLMFVLIMNGSIPVSLSVVLSIVAVFCIGWLVRHEMRVEEPMLPLALYRMPVLVISNSGNFIVGGMVMGLTAFLPTYVQGAMGEPAIVAGSVIGVNLVLWTCGVLTSTRLQTWFPYRVISRIGSVCLVAGCVGLAALHPGSPILQLYLAVVPLGFGFGMVNSTFVMATQGAVGWSERGAATSSNIFLRQIGQTIGAAAFGAVFNFGLYTRIHDSGNTIALLLDQHKRALLPPADIARDAAAISESMHGVYLTMVGLAVAVGVIASFFPANLKTLPSPQGAQAS